MLRIVFAGTPEFAVPALEALFDGPHQVVAVYCQPDRPAGRGRKLVAGPVKSSALAHGAVVMQPENFRSAHSLADLRAFDADLMVVAAYGLLLPQAVLDTPRLGCINIHASLLPRWRGASPIQHAILEGDSRSGVTLMKMDAGLDTGDMIASREVEIGGDWSAGQLHDSLAPLGASLLTETLADVESALRQARPQDDRLASYAPRLTKQQAEVDWRQPVERLLREIRAYNPWPVSHTRLGEDNLRLWRACAGAGSAGEPGDIVGHDTRGVYVRCGDGVLQVTELQFAGRNRCSAAQALNARDLTGLHLGA